MTLTKINSKGIKDSEILNADINASAAIAGTKITPDFGSQNISTTGNVGIGTTSPASAGSYSKFIQISDANSASVAISRSASGTAHTLELGAFSGISLIESTGATDLRFKINGSNRMVIESSGNVGIGIDNPASLLHVSSSTTSYFRFQDLASETIGLLIRKNITASAYTALDFRNGNGPSGTLTVSTGSVSLSNASDYRLKENETVISDGITKIKQLIPRRFNFKKDPTNTLDGFFAHEVSGVVPEAVIGEKDATIDEDGNGYQQLDATKLIPILTAGLKEAISKIETLETKVAALEAA